MKVTPQTRRQHYIIPLIYLAFQYFGIERTVTPETRPQHYIIPLIYLAFQYFGIDVPVTPETRRQHYSTYVAFQYLVPYLMKVTPETRRQHYIIPLIYLAFQYFGIERT